MTSTPAGTVVGPLLPAGCPLIVGIVNITADSFSDGGRYLDPAAAIAHARRLRADGADIIELGPAASHPDSVPVTAAEEQRRLAPVLGQLAADGIPVAVDSFPPADPAVRHLRRRGLAQRHPRVQCPRHVPGPGGKRVPADRHALHPALRARHQGGHRPGDGLGQHRPVLRRRLAALQAAGINRDRIIIDPGLGYFLGTTPEPSLATLAGIRQLKDNFGIPILVSPSRKSFLRALTGKDISRSGPATLAAEIFAAWQGADYIRTHDVTALRDALTLLAAITRQARQA